MSGDLTDKLPSDKLQQILDRLAGIENRLESIDTRLQAVEAESLDTKPIWERALAELVETNRTLDSIDRRLSVLNDDVLQMRADHRKLDERIANLERARS
jgi:chromosome segregation ATPase